MFVFVQAWAESSNYSRLGLCGIDTLRELARLHTGELAAPHTDELASLLHAVKLLGPHGPAPQPQVSVFTK